MNYNYYYNNVPGKGQCRNNLIYTSLMSEDKTEFVQWYYNDTEYHNGQNEDVDPALMQQKWERELIFLQFMESEAPNMIPRIIDIDDEQRKIFLEVQGPDFWEQARCNQDNFNSVCPDWQEQMLDILEVQQDLGLFKFSLHPSSYFLVNGRLKSINYFFCYSQEEQLITVNEHLSHISRDRQKELFPQMELKGISVNEPQQYRDLQMLCFDSFASDYPAEFIEEAKKIYSVQNNPL